jgi:hypothetical protein
MIKRLRRINPRKIFITIIVACVLVLGGLIITGSMLDNSDPITSGQYMVSNDPIPIPEVKPEDEGPNSHDSNMKELEELVTSTIEKGKEVISGIASELNTDEETKDKAKKVVGGGGIGIGTLIGAYLVYKWIFG